MSIAQRLVNFSDGLSAEGILSAAKGGTGNTTGGGTTSPTISQIAYLGNDTATDTAGGGLITLSGTNFASGAKVLINTTQVSVVTVVSATQITFTAPALSAGSYILYVVNLDGSTAIAVPGLQVSGVPSWTTAAGTLGSVYETLAVSATVTATSNSAVTYSVFSGTLPTGATLAANGTISGTSVLTNSSTTYTFTIRATDAENQDTDRSFSLTINPDVVSWSSPANAAALTSAAGNAYSSALNATSAAGQTVSYSANALPAGLAISGATITGTPTTIGSSSTTLTATAANTNRTAQVTINWTITVSGDLYWKNTTLLLPGTAFADSFVTDYSLNNFQPTVVGDTRASPLNPYQTGYYSNYFDGTGDYISVPDSTAFTMGAGDFTLEAWVYLTTSGLSRVIIGTCDAAGTQASMSYTLSVNASNIASFAVGYGGAMYGSTNTANPVPTNQWVHIAGVRSGANIYAYVNGVQSTTNTNMGALVLTDSSQIIGIGRNGAYNGEYVTGYISNARIVKGTAVYTTANFTPSTAPLTAISGTSLLTCQSNRLIDNSLNNFVVTKAGDTTVVPFNPFGVPASVTVNNLYSTYFDGTGDFLSVTGSAATNFSGVDWTIETWVYISSNPAQDNTHIIQSQTGINNWVPYLNIGLNTARTITCSLNSVGYTTTQTISLSTWTHLALVRSGGVVKLYINGTASSISVTTDIVNSNLSFWIGKVDNSPGGGSYIYSHNGYLSNVRFVKGTAVYTANFTPATANLTAITNTVLLTCQDATLRDNSTNQFAITSAGDARPVAQSPFTQTTTTVPLTAVGSAYFDGTGDYLTSTVNSAFGFGTGNWTIEGWVYLTDNTRYNAIFDTRVGTGTQAGSFGMGIYGTGRMQLYASGAAYFYPTETFDYNSWNHFAVVKYSNVTKIYKNGIAFSTTYADTRDYGTSQPIQIGNDDAGGVNAFKGYISDLRITKGTAMYTLNFAPPAAPLTAVTNTQLLTLQTSQPSNNSQFIDNSPAANLVTRFGNTTQGSFSPYGSNWSNYFDGTGDYLTAGTTASNFLCTGSATGITATFEAWVYPTAYSIGANAYNFSAIHTKGTTYFNFGVASGKARFYWFDGALKNVDSASTSDVPLNTWTHIAVTISGSTIKIYINGVLNITSATYTGVQAAGLNTAEQIGAEMNNYYFNGYISNYRLTRTVVYSAAFTPSTTPLTAIDNTVLLTCQSPGFVDNSPNNFTVSNVGDVSVQRFSPFGSVIQTPQTYSGFFDGTGDSLTGPSNAAFTLGTGDFTVECWVYPAAAYAVAPGNAIGGNYIAGSGGSDAYWVMGISATGTIYLGGRFTTLVASTGTVPLNTWTHISISRQSGTTKVFINGTVSGTSTTVMDFSATSTMYVGAVAPSAGFANWTGSISNFRVVKSVGVYTGNFTVPSTPLTTTQSSGTNISAITGVQTSLLTCQSTTFVDNSTNNFTITASGDAKPLKFNPFGYTNTTAQAYTPALYGSSAYFNGSSDSLSTPYNSLFVFGTNDFTVECWMYLTSNPTLRNLVGLGYGANGSGPVTSTWQIRYYGTEGSNQIGFNRYDGGTETNLLTSSAPIVTNSWFHIAVSRTGGTLKIFVNGVSYYSAANTFNYTAINTSDPFLVGLSYYGPQSGMSGPRYFPGYISNVRVIKGTGFYTTNFVPPLAPLTPTANTTLLLNMNKAGIADYTRSVDLETAGDAKITTESAYNGLYYSNYFDGTGDYFNIGNQTALHLGSGNLTVEMWIYKNANTAYMTACGDFASGPTNTFQILGDSTGSKIAWFDGAANTFTLTSSASIPISTWTHIAFVRNSTTLTLYINGVSDSSTTLSTNYNATTSFLVGHTPELIAGRYWNGYISNFRLVKGTAVYQANFTPSTAPLTAIANTVLLTCQSKSFVDNSSNNFTLTRNGDVAVKSFNPFVRNTNTSMLFDGTGDYLVLNSPTTNLYAFGSGDFTIEMWLYLNSVSGYPVFYDGRASGANSTTPTIYLNLGVLTYYDSGAGRIIGSSLSAGQWYHIAVTRSGTSTKLFINGTQSGSTYTDSTVYTNTINRPIIGCDGNAPNTNLLYGYIEDLRFTRGVARYTANFTPPSAKLQTK